MKPKYLWWEDSLTDSKQRRSAKGTHWRRRDGSNYLCCRKAR